MKFADWLYGPRAMAPPATDDFWYTDDPTGPYGSALTPQAGVPVSNESSMRVSAVQACVRIIAGTLAMLPFRPFRKGAGTSRVEAVDHRLYPLFAYAPNEYQTTFDYHFQQIANLCLQGNAISEKIPGARGAVSALWPIGLRDVRVDWLDRKSGRERVYDVASSHDGRPRVLRQRQVVHKHLLSLDGLVGLSPIGLAREGVSLSLALETHAARLFGSGARPAGFLTTESTYNEKVDEKLRKNWNRVHRGVFNHHDVAILWNGMGWQSFTMSQEDAQFLESRNFQVVDIARIYGVPTWLIAAQEKDTAWGTGLEQLGIAFVRYTLGMYRTVNAVSCNRWLLDDDPDTFFDYKLDELLRGDMQTQFEAWSTAINANDPWLTVNEIREKLNMPPLPGGDERRFPVNTSDNPSGPSNGTPSNGDQAAGSSNGESVDNDAFYRRPQG